MIENPYETPDTVRDGESLRDFRHAPLRNRSLAALIDFFAVSVLMVVTSSPFVWLSDATSTGSGMKFLDAKWLAALPIILLIVPLGYHTACLACFSATPGKQLMGIQVIHTLDGRIGFGRSVTRYIASCVSAGCLGIGYLVAFFDENRRTLHDRITGTAVVITREL